MCSACASLNKAVVSDPNRRLGLQNLRLSADYDVYQLRVDLIRQTTSRYRGNNHYQQLPTPYHPLGVELGNGLFYDANGNLTLNLDQLPELQHLNNFTIRKKERGSWNRVETYTKQDQSFLKEGSGLFSSKLKASLSDSAIVIDEGFLSPKNTIEVNAEGLQYGNGLFATSLKERSGSVVLKKFLNNEEYRQQGNTIYLDRDYLVAHKGEVIEITNARGLFRSIWHFIKIDNSYYFFDKHHRGVKITIRGQEVLVEENGRNQAIFLVENMN